MVGKIILYPGPDGGKARKFYFESGKIDFLRKNQGVTVISRMLFLNVEGKFVENLLVLMKGWHGWL